MAKNTQKINPQNPLHLWKEVNNENWNKIKYNCDLYKQGNRFACDKVKIKAVKQCNIEQYDQMHRPNSPQDMLQGGEK